VEFRINNKHWLIFQLKHIDCLKLKTQWSVKAAFNSCRLESSVLDDTINQTYTSENHTRHRHGLRNSLHIASSKVVGWQSICVLQSQQSHRSASQVFMAWELISPGIKICKQFCKQQPCANDIWSIFYLLYKLYCNHSLIKTSLLYQFYLNSCQSIPSASIQWCNLSSPRSRTKI